jgi:hypothetical protein
VSERQNDLVTTDNELLPGSASSRLRTDHDRPLTLNADDLLPSWAQTVIRHFKRNLRFGSYTLAHAHGKGRKLRVILDFTEEDVASMKF